MTLTRLHITVFLILILGLCGCGKGEDLKKQIQEKDQKISALEAEVKRIKDESAAKEQELKSQMETRIQKINSSHRQQVEGLNAKIADLEEKKKSTKPAAKPAASKKRRTGA